MNSSMLDPQIPEIVYHYTTISALYSIINGIKKKKGDYCFELYASHYRYANDPTEHKFLNNCLIEALRQYESQTHTDHSISNEYQEYMHKIEVVRGEPVIISLSEAKDDLSMWRMYGGNGAGVALGVNVRNQFCKNVSLNFMKCTYFNEEELVGYFLSLGEAKDVYTVFKNKNKKKIRNTMLSLMDRIASAKQDCFSIEKEWRIVDSKSWREFQFRERNGMIIPYIPVCLSIECLKEILIGPCGETELNSYAIKSFLKKKLGGNDRGIKVECSKKPYINR